MRNSIGLIAILFLVACAANEPIIYQSKSTAQKGEANVTRDVEACRAEAETKGLKPTRNSGGDLAKNTVKGGAVGGAAGAAGGAASGGSVGRNAKYGAAVGATATFVTGLFRTSKPNSTYRRYVERCLADLGYDVVGWD